MTINYNILYFLEFCFVSFLTIIFPIIISLVVVDASFKIHRSIAFKWRWLTVIKLKKKLDLKGLMNHRFYQTILCNCSRHSFSNKLIYNFCFFADSPRFTDCDWSLWFSIRSGNSNRDFADTVNQVISPYEGWR